MDTVLPPKEGVDGPQVGSRLLVDRRWTLRRLEGRWTGRVFGGTKNSPCFPPQEPVGSLRHHSPCLCLDPPRPIVSLSDVHGLVKSNPYPTIGRQIQYEKQCLFGMVTVKIKS